MENRTNADPKPQSDHVMFYPMVRGQVPATPFQYVQVVGQNLKQYLVTGVNSNIFKTFPSEMVLQNKPRVAVKQVSSASMIHKPPSQQAKTVIVPSNGNNIVVNNNQTMIRKDPQRPTTSNHSVIRGPMGTQAGIEWPPRYVIPNTTSANPANYVKLPPQVVYAYQNPVYQQASMPTHIRESNNNPPSLGQQKNGYYAVMAPSMIPTTTQSVPSVSEPSTGDSAGSKRPKPTIISGPSRQIPVGNPRSLIFNHSNQPPAKIPKIDSPEVNIKVTTTENLNISKPTRIGPPPSTGGKIVTTAGTFKLSSEKPMTPLRAHTGSSGSVIIPKQPRKKGRERKQLLPQPTPPARDDVSTDEADENQDEPLEENRPGNRIHVEQETVSDRLSSQSAKGRKRKPRLSNSPPTKKDRESFRHFLRLSESSTTSSTSTSSSSPSSTKSLAKNTVRRVQAAETSLHLLQKEESEINKRLSSIVQKLQVERGELEEVGARLSSRSQSSTRDIDECCASMSSILSFYSRTDRHPERTSRETPLLRKLLRKTKQKS